MRDLRADDRAFRRTDGAPGAVACAAAGAGDLDPAGFLRGPDVRVLVGRVAGAAAGGWQGGGGVGLRRPFRLLLGAGSCQVDRLAPLEPCGALPGRPVDALSVAGADQRPTLPRLPGGLLRGRRLYARRFELGGGRRPTLTIGLDRAAADATRACRQQTAGSFGRDTRRPANPHGRRPENRSGNATRAKAPAVSTGAHYVVSCQQ